MKLMVFAVTLSLSCGYSATFHDCTIACSAPTGCPSGLSCGTEGLCRSGETMTSCGSMLGVDAATSPADAASDAQPRDVTLSENGSDVTGAGFTCTPCPSTDGMGEFPVELHWYREFSLTDFSGSPLNVTGSLHVTTMHVGCSMAVGNPTITAELYAYSQSTLFSSTIDASSLTEVGQGSAQVTASSCNSDVQIPMFVSQDIAADSAFVVAIDVIETLEYDSNVNPSCSIDPMFKIGANTSSDSRRSYYESPTSNCATGSATSSPTVWSGSDDVVISVEGTTD